MSDDTTNTDTTTDVATTATGDTQGIDGSAPDRSEHDSPASERQRAEQHDRADRSKRKTRDGVVVSSGMDKTAVVAVIERVRHPKYNKFVLQTKRLYAHDETNDVNVGDRVRVMECRPLSKTKRWRVTDVLERAK